MSEKDLTKKKLKFSLEIFPPKTIEGEKKLWEELQILKKNNPHFISVTYGAGGSTQKKTLDLSLKIKNDLKISPLVHFTCVGAGKKEIKNYLEQVKKKGIKNILALRGDPPQGEDKFIPHPNGFSYANELVEYIKKLGDFNIAVAGYPEGHLEAPSLEVDLNNLKRKVEAGASCIITQLFYDNNGFYNFLNKARQKNITIPIVPGIMPLTNLAQLKKIPTMFGVSIPKKLEKFLNDDRSDEYLLSSGIEYSVKQCLELEKWGLTDFHLYTLNKSLAAKKIIEGLSL